MSKKKTTRKKKKSGAEAAAEDATFDAVEEQPAQPETIEDEVPAPQPESSEPAAQQRTDDAVPRGRSGGFVAWLALIAALLALAAFGFDYVRDRRAAGDSLAGDAALADVNSSVRALQDSVASLQQDVNALSDRLYRHDGAIEETARELAERLQQIESLRGRIATIEGSVASLQGISTGAKDAWLLAEAEYYMQIANAQLQLAGNPQLASLALGLADERILQLANPALTDVRRALSNELRSLEALVRPDTAGVTLTLASLAAVVDSLPLKQGIALSEDEETAVDEELTGTDRALASLRSALDSVVSVRRTDEALQPLIAPEAQYFLRANLALQLQAARLAMLRGEEGIFQQSLDDATAWISEYYDTDSAPVQSALNTIADIRDSVFSVAVPDISESLRLLRQFNALADAAAQPAVEPAVEPGVELVVEPVDEPVVEPVVEPVDETVDQPAAEPPQ
jgi:uroporphyrin-3 C-methyltransferase